MIDKKNTFFSNYRFSIWTVVVISALTIVGYFFMRANADHTSASPAEKITIAYSVTPDAALAEVAQMKGYFLQEGLEAIPHRHPYGKLALQEVLDGSADFATVAETPVMFAIMKGEGISIIATIQTSHKSNAIVARKDKGILTPSDLKDKKIGATLGTTSQFFMDAFLAVHGISRTGMQVIALKPNELQTALTRGEIDAASMFNPYISSMQKILGNREITFYDEDIYTQAFNIVATREYIRKNPEQVKRLLRALLKAEEFVRQNPDEAQKSVADFTKIDSGLIRKIWGDTEFSVRLDQSLLLAMEDESEWAIKNKLTDNPQIPNYLDFIYFDGLQSVKPEAVMILK